MLLVKCIFVFHNMIRCGLDFCLQPQPATRVRRPPAAQNRQAVATEKTQVDEPASPTASTSSGEAQEDMDEDKDPPEVPAPASPVAAVNAQKLTVTQSIAGLSKPTNAQKSTVSQSIGGSSKPTTSNEEAMDTASSPVQEAKSPPPPGQDAVLEESIRVTRGRLRRTRVTSIR
uniref:Uncharacterized protein n=1 Tax=Daucus carota subsp. sativus TaxID=79200 RepID=A0A165Y2Q6_DAUCS